MSRVAFTRFLFPAFCCTFAATCSLAAVAGEIDVENSKVYVFVPKRGAGHEHGVEGRLSAGALQLGAAEQAGTMTFDLRSFDADTTAARRFLRLPGETDADTAAKVNANMRGEAVLDTARHPTAEFQIVSASALNEAADPLGTPYELNGVLTLHGVRKELRVRAFAQSVNGLTRVRGKFTLKQTNFGIVPFSKLLGAIGVGDELTVYGDLWIKP